MSDDINSIAARMREAAGKATPGSDWHPFAPGNVLALLDDWERLGRREREAVDFCARAAALDRRRIVDMLDLKEGRQTALDALAALTARVAELEAERDRQGALLLEWSDQGRRHVARLREIDALAARVAELEAALEPVGDVAERYLAAIEGRNLPDGYPLWGTYLVGHLRRGRAVLAKKG